MVLFGLLWLEGGEGEGGGRGHGWRRVLGRYPAACNALALVRGEAIDSGGSLCFHVCP